MGGAYLRSRIKQAGKWDQETIVSFFLCQYCSGEYLPDLDFFIVSESLFSRIKDEFKQWYADYYSEVVKPRNDNEAGFWRDNAIRGERNLARGFIDAKIIPNLEPYRWTREISQTLWLLSKRLEVTTGAPQVKNMSIRCYKTWNDFITQTFLNVDYSSHQGQ
ncbi:hypothetical protein KAM345_039460 [Aeromonas caviae]|nr:hypothetical protein KAM345_039460 [Aeromonas caviae]